MVNLAYWVGFNRTKGIGPARLQGLIQYFGSIEAAWNAPVGALRATGLDQRTLNSLLKTRATCDLEAELNAIQDAGISLLCIEDDAYPPLLKKISDAPPLLYIKGTLIDADSQAIAIVGTRRATLYGKTLSEHIARGLVQHGITVVSGLAVGIDAAAHRAALDAGGRTIAVMPCGLDRIFPPENRQLAEEIIWNGALISELPLGEGAEKSHFAPRNRLVSGLSLGTIVIEAPAKSGALITADLALEQGREVFAVPGNVSSPNSAGTNLLIQSGAKLVTSVDDILEELKLTSGQSANQSETSASPSKIFSKIAAKSPPSFDAKFPVQPFDLKDVTEIEQRILQALSSQALDINQLSRHLELPVQTVSSSLTLLELKGLIQQLGNMQYTVP